MDTDLLAGGCWVRGPSVGSLTLSPEWSARRTPELYGLGEPDPETLRRHAREDAALEAAEARWAAREAAQALYRAQRRQALSAIAGGLLVMVLVIAAAV